LGIAGLAAGVIHSAIVAPRQLQIYRRAVHLPRLPIAFDGYRILHISDIHIGGLASGAEQVLIASGLDADLIVVTGDMVDRKGFAEPCAQLIGSLRAPDGVVCVMGNHDNRATYRDHDFPPLVELLAQRGVRTLINEAVAIKRDGARFWLVGVDDPHRLRDDLALAYDGIGTEEPSVLLAHSPDIMERLAHSRADLVLVGHCHGGQVRTPWGPIYTRTYRVYPDVLGLQRIDGTPVHLSGGLGSTYPFRFLCPPEVTVLHLVAGEEPREFEDAGGRDRAAIQTNGAPRLA